MHVLNRAAVRIGAFALVVLYVLWAVVRARYGRVASAGLSAVYLAALVAAVWWWLFSISARVRRGWPTLSKSIGLWQQQPVMRINETFAYTYPQIRRVRRHALGFDVTVRLLPGQVPKDVADHVEGIAHTWRVFRVDASSPTRGVVVLRAWFAYSLARPFDAAPVSSVGHVLNRDAGLTPFRFGDDGSCGLGFASADRPV